MATPPPSLNRIATKAGQRIAASTTAAATAIVASLIAVSNTTSNGNGNDAKKDELKFVENEHEQRRLSLYRTHSPRLRTEDGTNRMMSMPQPTRNLQWSSFLTQNRCQCEAAATTTTATVNSTASIQDHIDSLRIKEEEESNDNNNNNNSNNNQQEQHHRSHLLNIQRSRTLRILTSKATQNRSLDSEYSIDWDQDPIGEGAFGHVLMAQQNVSGERVALKRIPKKLASREDFQREMEALLRIQKWYVSVSVIDSRISDCMFE